jgi:protein SCO1
MGYARALSLLYACLGLAVGRADAATTRDVQERVGVSQHLGRTVSSSIALLDERGARVRLGDFLGSRPTVVALVYYECPNLCTLTLTALVGSLRTIDLSAGHDFNVLAVSIDPREGPALAAAKRDAYVARYGRGARVDCPRCDRGWHFLTGTGEQTGALARELGIRYFWDSEQEQYAHPAAIVILTPQGRIAQYFNGVDFPPHEIRRALQQAATERVGSLAERLWLLCYHYAALQGRYSGLITASLRWLALTVVVALATLIVRLIRSSP